MAWIRDVQSLYNFIGYVVLRAPDWFPKEDYLQDHEQMTLERAFEEIRTGVSIVQADFSELVHLAEEPTLLLNESLAFYRAGEHVKGAQRL